LAPGTEHQISPEIESDLHAYLGGIIRELRRVALCINGMDDQVHLLVRMPATYSGADLARLVKTNSSRWLYERGPQRKKFGWQPARELSSVSESGQNAVREYILQQQEHHLNRSFKEEFGAFLQKNHIAIDGEYLWS
jgi:REP-associated tyrosine transposase